MKVIIITILFVILGAGAVFLFVKNIKYFNIKKNPYEWYELYSIILGISLILTFLYAFIVTWGRCLIPFEPVPLIRISEILLTLSICPYYIHKIIKSVREI